MRGIAEGAGVGFEDVLAINTRTEVMFAAKAREVAQAHARAGHWFVNATVLTTLVIGACLERADPRDAWVGPARSWAEVPQGARVVVSRLGGPEVAVPPTGGTPLRCSRQGGAGQLATRPAAAALEQRPEE